KECQARRIRRAPWIWLKLLKTLLKLLTLAHIKNLPGHARHRAIALASGLAPCALPTCGHQHRWHNIHVRSPQAGTSMLAASLSICELQQDSRVTDIGLAGLGERTPTREVLAPQAGQRRDHVCKPLLQVLQHFAWKMLAHEIAPDPGVVQRDRSLAAVILDRERVTKPRGAVDLHRVGRHAPTLRAAQLDASRRHGSSAFHH